MNRIPVRPRHAIDHSRLAPTPRRLSRLAAVLAVGAVGIGGMAVAHASVASTVQSPTTVATALPSRDVGGTSRSVVREPLATASATATPTQSDEDGLAVASRRLMEERAAQEKAAKEAAAAKKKAAEARKKAAAAKAAAKKKRAAAKARSLPVDAGSFRISATFGQTGLWSKYHTGLDFAASTGTQVHAVVAGTVVADTVGSWAGTHIVVKAADGTFLVYCHLSAKNVSVGDRVQAGDRIGRVGETGRAFGPHLHLEHYAANQRPGDIYSASDPARYLERLGLSL